ncbi:glycosyltransferase family 2 protein [Anaeromyxobacter paludicola]|uniref:Glycosyl hydrolase n=1 Tax=Anaeromyxobacter paludicola TaxID=2918171 RepID=A0ABM7X5T1_9BACT|nr:glycosyltransferase family 2 protein [Anaeromyxobacter paludicola]BDG07174.1 glycosyl hydrolase [Anaeromyxobacter paludicola]
MPLITVVTPCYNEEANVEEVYRRVKAVMDGLPGYQYEHLFIDNASKDRTPDLLRALAAADPKVKVILNAGNFGHIRSPYHGMLQAEGDAVVSLVSDLQDPPEMIPELLRRWEAGAKIVAAVKRSTEEGFVMAQARKTFYRVLARISDAKLIRNFTGFGLYDKQVIQLLRGIDDPNPYFRGLISELGYEPALVPYDQPLRKKGKTKNNFFTLFDMAMLGLTKHSRAPLRIATLAGFGMAALSLLISLAYLVMKLVFWNEFQFGLAPLLIGIYFFGSVQIFFIGILGEYVGSIQTHVRHLPLVVERERLNFGPAGAREGGGVTSPPSPAASRAAPSR